MFTSGDQSFSERASRSNTTRSSVSGTSPGNSVSQRPSLKRSVSSSSSAARAPRDLIVEGILHLNRAVVTEPFPPYRREERDWESLPACLRAETLQYGASTIAVSRIVIVTTPVELGAFVFQIHLRGGEVVTLRAPTFSEMMDWCEGLWRLLKYTPAGSPTKKSKVFV